MSSRLPCIASLAQIITTSCPDYDRSPPDPFSCVCSCSPLCWLSQRAPLNTYQVTSLSHSTPSHGYPSLLEKSTKPSLASLKFHESWPRLPLRSHLLPLSLAVTLPQPEGRSCCFLPQALYAGHLLCRSSAERSHLLHSGLWKLHHI